MMNVLEVIKKIAKSYAEVIQTKSSEMSGTELNTEKTFIPNFNATRQYLNYPIGYICKSSEGRVVKLVQPYDSNIYTQQPEELPAHWGFVWSKEAEHALPYVSIATSPFNTGECCTENDIVYRSTIDNNVWSPSSYPQGWERV